MTNLNEYKINIYNEVNGAAAVSSIDGKSIYEKVKAALNTNKSVILDFLNIEFVTSAFFNTALGALYKDFSDEKDLQKVEVKNLSDNDYSLYMQVMQRAKEYYTNPEYRDKLLESLNEIEANGDN